MKKDVPKVLPLSWQKIEDVTESLVKEVSPATLNAAQPFPIFELCEFRLEELCGVSLVVENLPIEVEGRFEGDELILNEHVYHGAMNSESRARFTLAHELGHCVLHKEQLQELNSRPKANVLYRRGTFPIYRDPEWQANAFAASILMPVVAMQEIRRTVSIDALPETVSKRLQVSRISAEYRIERLTEIGVLN